MCGIIGKFNFKKKDLANYTILNQYIEQKSRGSEGFGMVAFNMPNKKEDKCEFYLVHKETQKEMINELMDKKFDNILFHHRWPTSTSNRQDACHPFWYEYNDKEYFVVHNGVISNSEEIRNEFHKNLSYISHLEIQDKKEKLSEFNDSECLGWELILMLNGEIPEIRTKGTIAFVVIEKDKDDIKIYFGRNYGSPLQMIHNEDELYLSSEGKELDIKPNILYSLSFLNPLEIIEKSVNFPSNYSYEKNDYSNKNNYKHGWKNCNDYDDDNPTGFANRDNAYVYEEPDEADILLMYRDLKRSGIKIEWESEEDFGLDKETIDDTINNFISTDDGEYVDIWTIRETAKTNLSSRSKDRIEKQILDFIEECKKTMSAPEIQKQIETQIDVNNIGISSLEDELLEVDDEGIAYEISEKIAELELQNEQAEIFIN